MSFPVKGCHQWKVGKGLHGTPSSPLTMRPSPLLNHLLLHAPSDPTLAPCMPVSSVACRNPTTALSFAYAPRVILLEYVLLGCNLPNFYTLRPKILQIHPLSSLSHRILRKKRTLEIILDQPLSFTNKTQKGYMTYG